jgi:ankyrin repeat protein
MINFGLLHQHLCASGVDLSKPDSNYPTATNYDASGIDLSEPDPNHPKAIHYAKIPENVEGINNFDARGNTPIINAVVSGVYEAVKNLLKGGADPNVMSQSNKTALVLAAERGLYHCARALVEAGADVHQKSSASQSPLLAAINSGHAEIVSLLVDHKALASEVLSNSQSLLMIATYSSRNVEIVKRLIRGGADVNYRDSKLTSALMFAAAGGSEEIVQVLIDAGAHVDDRSDTGCTALLFAASRKHVTVIQVLLDSGANVNAKDKYGRSAVGILMEYSASQDEAVDKMIRLLYEYGIDLERYIIDVTGEMITSRSKYFEGKEAKRLSEIEKRRALESADREKYLSGNAFKAHLEL